MKKCRFYLHGKPNQFLTDLYHALEERNPNLDMINNFECDSCGHEQELEVPVTANFFWPE